MTRRGRPRVREQRDQQIHLRLTAAELGMIELGARAAGVSRARWLLEAAGIYRPPERAEDKV